MSRCVSCGAHIIWVETENGKKMPIDSAPAMLCGITVKEQTDMFHTNYAVVHPVIYRSHFETCPNAREHRESED